MSFVNATRDAWPIDKGEAPALDLRSGCKR